MSLRIILSDLIKIGSDAVIARQHFESLFVTLKRALGDTLESLSVEKIEDGFRLRFASREWFFCGWWDVQTSTMQVVANSVSRLPGCIPVYKLLDGEAITIDLYGNLRFGNQVAHVGDAGDVVTVIFRKLGLIALPKA